MNPFLRKAIIAIVVLLALELGLRLIGFGEVPLYYESSKYEYALVPSQDISRFGNHFLINKEGMRSSPLRSNSRRILKFGDSVLNGGVSTDQEELASSILEKNLNEEFDDIQVLNVSAGSWEPDNAYAWMEVHGAFDAQMIVLVFSSHDWKDRMTFRQVVGNVPFYPDEQPLLAISDAIGWIGSRFLVNTSWEDLPIQKGAPVSQGINNPGWTHFVDYCKITKTPLLVYHHPNLQEFKNNSWNSDGEELQDFLRLNNVKTVSGLEAAYETEDYRDLIHLNEKGQVKIANALFPVISLELENNGF